MLLTIYIFILVLLIAASCLCVFLIVYFKKYYEQVEAARKDFNRLVENTVPILNNLEEVTGSLNRMTAGAEDYWDGIETSIKSLRNIISIFSSWKIIRGVKSHSLNLIKKIRSVTSTKSYL